MQVNDLLGLGSEPGSARSPTTDDPFQVGPMQVLLPSSRQGSPVSVLEGKRGGGGGGGGVFGPMLMPSPCGRQGKFGFGVQC